ncbi:cytochrome P450 [Streptomyces sp. CAU 1734]|uniref:cytochrome P450 n=1 Tax=Streptomyces sp. CAU 1734 TaxID=3140360 RepID=UPI003261A607
MTAEDEQCPFTSPAHSPGPFRAPGKDRAPVRAPAGGAALSRTAASRAPALAPRAGLWRTAAGAAGDHLKFLTGLCAHGDLVRVGAGPWQAYVICHPEPTLAVLMDDRTFERGGPLFDQLRTFLGNGLLTCGHGEHRTQRRQVQPGFRRDRMPLYAGVMTERIDAVLGTWRDGQRIDPREEMFAIAAGVAVSGLFGGALEERAITDLRRAMEIILSVGFRRMLTPSALAGKLPTRGNARYDRAQARVREIVYGVIREHRAESRRGDLLSILLSAGEAEDVPALTDAEVYDQVLSLMAASFETTAAVLAWSCHLLAAHPEAQRRLHAEARAVLGGEPAGHGHLPRLRQARNVLLEALRLYPPAWVLTRVTTRDASVGGYRVPRGATVVLSPYVLHRRADLFPRPGDFLPDRWSDPAASTRPQSGFLPFGSGARQCIGNDFALLEATLVLATVADRWRLTAPAGTPMVRPVRNMSLMPAAGSLTLHSR